MTENGVNLIKKKVAALKLELDECQVRASEAEEQLTEKESIIEKVCHQRGLGNQRGAVVADAYGWPGVCLFVL